MNDIIQNLEAMRHQTNLLLSPFVETLTQLKAWCEIYLNPQRFQQYLKQRHPKQKPLTEEEARNDLERMILHSSFLLEGFDEIIAFTEQFLRQYCNSINLINDTMPNIMNSSLPLAFESLLKLQNEKDYSPSFFASFLSKNLPPPPPKPLLKEPPKFPKEFGSLPYPTAPNKKPSQFQGSSVSFIPPFKFSDQPVTPEHNPSPPYEEEDQLPYIPPLDKLD